MEENSISTKIIKVHKEIMKKQQNVYLQVGYFFLIICAMSFIISSIFTDMMSTLYVYFEKRKVMRSSEKTKSIRTGDDNHFEETVLSQDNQLDAIEENIMIQHTKQKKRMEETQAWKRAHNIPNQKLESQIDLSILEEKHDNYTYHNKDNGMSFWKMLLMPPKYHELVQHSAKPYYKFVKDE